MSTIEAVTAVKLADQPCCVEILVAHVDHSLPEEDEFEGIIVFPDEHGVITLDLGEARALRARLDLAIRALEPRASPGQQAGRTEAGDARDGTPRRGRPIGLVLLLRLIVRRA